MAMLITLSFRALSRRPVALVVALGLAGGTLTAALSPTARAAVAPASAGAGLALTALTSTPASSAPASFYQPPSPLPAGAPGTLLRHVRIGDVAGAQAWAILYLSRSARNRPIAVSGTVLVPRGRPPATMPIVGVASGTVGLGDDCAPSKHPLTLSLQAGDTLKRGYAIAATDYEGMGTPGRHPYVVGRSEGHTVIDAVRAAQQLPPAGLSARSPVALWGYSQGGGAVAWAAELQPSYAPELNLKGVAEGGVPADLQAVAAALEGRAAFGIVPMAALGFDAAYPELHLADYLNARGTSLLTGWSTLCVGPIVLSAVGETVTGLTVRNPLQDPAWIARLEQNKLGRHPPRVPVFLYHAYPFDEAVAYPQAAALMRTYCAAGVTLTWRRYLGEHLVAALAGMNDAQNFVRDRLAGRPAGTTCPR